MAIQQLPTWRFTVDDFLRMIEAGLFAEDDRVELIDGEVVRMATVGNRHVAAVIVESDLFKTLAGDAAVVSVQNALDLSPFGRPEPDIVLLRPPRGRYQSAPGAADVLLVVEIADSSLAIDRDRKIPLYGRAAIPEAWLVNLIDDLIRIYREPTAEGYRVIQTAGRGETIAPLAFPEWRIPVDDLLPAPPPAEGA